MANPTTADGWKLLARDIQSQIDAILAKQSSLDAQLASAKAESDRLANAALSKNFGDLNDPAVNAAFRAARAAASAFRTGPLLAAQQAADTYGKLVDLRKELENANTQAATADKPAGDTATASAGDTVKEAQQAKDSPNDDNPNTIQPTSPSQIIDQEGRIKPTPPLSSGSNALKPPTVENGDSTIGTNSGTVTLTESQSVPQSTNAAGNGVLVPEPPPATTATIDAGGANGSQDQFGANASSGTLGVGAGNDDITNKNATRQEIDNIFSQAIIRPQGNTLDKYATYTYAISVYLMSPDDYRNFLLSRNKSTTNFPLLFQSGGANVSSRNMKYFSLDYYVDRLVIQDVAPGKGSGASHNAKSLSFVVTEPNGITLIPRLEQAMTEYIFKGDKALRQNWPQQNFLLAVRFYGFDVNGKPISPADNNYTVSDPRSIVEKFIPFSINSLTFKIAGKAVEYNWDCTAMSHSIAASTDRGTIPTNIELAGSNLKEIFIGQTPNPTDSSTPPNASTAPTKKSTVTQGIITAMNEWQKKQVADGKQSEADTYEILFASDALANAQLTYTGGADITNSPMSKSKNPSDTKDPARQSTDFTNTTVRAVAGMQLLKFMDQIAKNSTYIQDQAKVTYDPKTNKQISTGASAKNLAWFNFQVQARPSKWDKKRNMFACDITYLITPYQVATVDSSYFPNGTFRGVHKSYPYWFTGQNTAVINYEQTYNNLFVRLITGGPNNEDTRTSDLTQLSRRIVRPSSNSSRQGAPGTVNEAPANASDWLYDPESQAKSTMTIIGDPAWIYQGDLVNGITTDSFAVSPFLADGTINYQASEVYYEITFNKPTDYNLRTGLMDVTQNTLGAEGDQGDAKVSYVYKIININSTFTAGKFTQELEGILFAPPAATQANSNTIPESDNPLEQSAAETARLTRQNAGTQAAAANNSNSVPPVNTTSGTASPNDVTNTTQGPTDIPDSAPIDP
jgi:hypothetical protein